MTTEKPTLADDLAALIAAREAATKGPWESEGGRVRARRWMRTAVVRDNGADPTDLTFIALAANVIEAHGAELAALVAENARLLEAIERAGLTIVPDDSPDAYEHDWQVPLRLDPATPLSRGRDELAARLSAWWGDRSPSDGDFTMADSILGDNGVFLPDGTRAALRGPS